MWGSRLAAVVVLLAASACVSPIRTAFNRPVRHREGSHQHEFAAALRANDEPSSLGRVPAQIYVVQRGDTLYSLARSRGLSVQELASFNGLARPEELQAGARLRFPPQKNAPLATATAPRPAAKAPAPIVAPTATLAAAPAKRTSSYMLQWPLDGQLTSRFGSRSGHAHDGIDIGAPKGTDVKAAADGDVVFADAHGGYGNVVILRHANGLLTIYAHHERNLVRKGQRVHAGDTIARVGTTGRSTGPHLHFEVRAGTRPSNPLRYLPP